MLSSQKKPVRSLIFNESEQITNKQTLRTLLLISIVAALGVLIVNIIGGATQMAFLTAIFVALLVISFVFLQRGVLIIAQVSLPTALYITVLFAVISDFGLHDASMFAFAAVISLASLTLGQRGAIFFSSLIVLSILLIGVAELQGLLISETSALTTWVSIIYLPVLVIAFTAIQGILTRLLQQSATVARENEQVQFNTNVELRELQITLEKRVEERTQQAQKRADQLESVATVARSIAIIQEMDRLLPEITELLSERFGFYHVGVFLLDASKEFAVLHAANSAGGQKMLARNHRLRVGQQGIVGYTTSKGDARIALNVGEEAVYFNNPDLPETQSEVALPLMVGREIIGALDIQSTEANAFSQEDVDLFSTLADQVSIAIQNARSLVQAQESLREAELAARQLTGQAWETYNQTTSLKGYRFDGRNSQPLSEIGGISAQGSLRIPIRFREQEVANLVLEAPAPDYQWTEDEIAMAQAAADRTALALEGARLLEDAQRRASTEQAISEITAKIGATTNIDNILRSTVQELGIQLGDTEIMLKLESDQE